MTDTKPAFTAAGRNRARKLAMQGLYQWEMTRNSAAGIEAQFHSDNDMEKVDTEYLNDLLFGAIKLLDAGDGQGNELDNVYLTHLTSVKMDELDPVTKAILRSASYELKERADVPYRVAIAEAITLSRKFCAKDTHKFVNGVLDKVAAHHRKAEFDADRNKTRSLF